MDWTSDSDNDHKEALEWESEEEKGAAATIRPPSPCENAGPSEVCEAGSSRPQLVSHFMGMGFSEDLVLKAIKENGEEDSEAVLETLLTYTALEKSPPKQSQIQDNWSSASDGSEDDNLDEDVADGSDFEDEDFTDILADDKKLLTLVEMGFSTNEASAALSRCGIASNQFI